MDPGPRLLGSRLISLRLQNLQTGWSFSNEIFFEGLKSPKCQKKADLSMVHVEMRLIEVDIGWLS